MAGLKREKFTGLRRVILAFGPSSELAVLGWEYPRASLDCLGDPGCQMNHAATDSIGNKNIIRFVSAVP
jgi:hypothetical protein